MTDKNIQMSQYNGSDYDNLFPATIASIVKATAISGYIGTDVQALLAAIGAALITHKTSGDHDSRYFTETELSATTDSAAGADRIGATAISGLTGTTVQAILEALKSFIDTTNTNLANHKTSGDHDSRYFTETELSATTDSAAGADRIGATTVTGYIGNTVQTILEAIGAALVTHKISSDHDSRYFTETELGATTDGIAGADRIGATAISGLSGNTVQAILESLKNYTDAVKQSLDLKDSVKVATVANLSATYSNSVLTASTVGVLSIDGVTLAAGQRVLIKDQSTAAQNGIYVVTNAGSASTYWIMTRAADADDSTSLTAGSYTFVEEGTVNADSGWVMTQNGTITIGTTAVTWAQFSGAGQITAGSGLSKSGNTLSIASDGVTSTMIAAGAADDTAIGNKTITDTTAPTADAAALTVLLSNIGYMLKSITGQTSWRTVPGTTLAAAATHIAAAAPHSGHVLASDVVATATANKILKLDASGLLPASITGNAATATKLAAPRAINGTNFDGSAAITVPINVAADATNATRYVIFTGVTAGNTPAYTDAGLTYNPSTNVLGANISGNANTIGNFDSSALFNTTNCAYGVNSYGYWVQYPNGWMEIVQTIPIGTKNITYAWGGIYTTGGATYLPNFPVAFVDTPVVNMWVHAAGTGTLWLLGNGQPTTTTPPSYELARGASWSVSNIVIAYRAIGRWK